MSPTMRSSASLRIEHDEQWWDPSTDIYSMELDRGFPGHTLTVVLIGHAMPDLPYNVPLRVRCSWDHQNYWVGTAKLSSHEVSGEPDPFQRIILQGVFEREEPS